MIAMHKWTGATAKVVGIYKKTFTGVIMDARGTGWKQGVKCPDLSKEDWHLVIDWRTYETLVKDLGYVKE